MAKPVYTHCPVCRGTNFTAVTYYHDCGKRGPEAPPPAASGPIPEGPLFCQICGKFRYEAVLYCHGCHHVELKELEPPKGGGQGN